MGMEKMNNDDQYRNGTNCFGSIHLDGVLLPMNEAEIDPFLKADRYETISAKRSNYEVGDIISWGGAHFIIATGKDEKGNMIWFSKMVGAPAIKGTLSEIQKYNRVYGEDYGKIQKSTILYRQTYKNTKLTKEDWAKIAKRTKEKLEDQL